MLIDNAAERAEQMAGPPLYAFGIAVDCSSPPKGRSSNRIMAKVIKGVKTSWERGDN